ncbi:Transcription termination factor like [Quillaja saponaria]|uniref:Transcription termination factor like n=1 Tax=Quillaja saponaria TaxID=32244 RepID=A0AAD7QEW5_QUISA|nr:Transcription termination factor like [Quillaja saponaria]
MFYFLCKVIPYGNHIGKASPTILNLVCLQKQGLFLKCFSSSSNGQSFTVSYLINKCGFSPETAASATKYVYFENPEKPDSVIQFFRDHGFSETQISNFIRRRPRLLLSNPEKSLLPKLEFFKSKGLLSSDVAKIISSYANILHRSLEKQIIPSFDFFKKFLQSDSNTIQAVKRFKEILASDVDTSAAPNIELLRENRVPELHIITTLKYQPRALMMNSKRFEEIVEEVKEMGFNPLRLKFMVAVIAMTSMSKSTRARKADVYKRWGWSDNDVLAAFGRCPWCMMASEDKIDGVMDFLVKKLDVDASCIAKHPQVMTLSLDKRIIPRGSVIQVLLSKGLLKTLNLNKIFDTKEKSFLEKYVLPHEKESSELLKLYQVKLDLAR